ncbi:unnamed protein product [Dicrocoelium dendriticum]|nr:unnamed protein product [Dicrocoelium dendriticum]
MILHLSSNFLLVLTFTLVAQPLVLGFSVGRSTTDMRPKRWSLTEIHRCGPIKGYSCQNSKTCQERYQREDMLCFEVYPCLSSCIFAAQLLDLSRFRSQVEKLMFEGIPVNTHEDPINYVRNLTRILKREDGEDSSF